jgi:hypothetical protein
MPKIVRWHIKTALVYLVAALLLALLAALPPLTTRLPGLFPVSFHLLAVGWLTQLIFGVVLWMFPKYSRERPRGSESLGWAVYILLNLGLVLRAVAEPQLGRAPLWGWLLVVSAVLQGLAGMLFVSNTWPRVKER